MPEEAEIVFIGLDANYAADVELTSAFPSILDYHEDGVAFWRRHGVHHPFQLPGYRVSRKTYHRNFARIGFTPEDASRVSFVELLHLATTGVNQKLDVDDFAADHLARIDALVTAGASRRVFASDKVLRLMRATRRFSWLNERRDRSADLPVVYGHGDTTVHLHLHFSNYGKFQEQMVREAQAIRVPFRGELKSWMNETLAQVSAKSPMALAIGYSLSNWTTLTNFVDDGRIDVHNTTAERALRGVAIGRKNYLHVGSDAGGHTAAVMYTLLGTAKLNGINPQRYLRHVLERIADHPSNRIDELLPWVVAAKWEDDASAKDMPLAA